MKHLIEKAIVALNNSFMSNTDKDNMMLDVISSYINASMITSGIPATIVETFVSDDLYKIGTKDMVMHVIINHSNDAVIDFSNINPLINGGMIIPLIFNKVEKIEDKTHKYVFFMPEVREYTNLIIMCLLNIMSDVLSVEINSTLSISECLEIDKGLGFKIKFDSYEEFDDKLLSETIVESLNKLLKRQFYPNGYYNLSNSYSRTITTSRSTDTDGSVCRSVSMEFIINNFDSKLAISSMWKAIIHNNRNKERYIKEKIYVA